MDASHTSIPSPTRLELDALDSAIERACREAKAHVNNVPAAHACLDEALLLSSLKRKLCAR